MNADFAKKIIKIQEKTKVNKDLYNDFGNFNYRSAEQILESVKPVIHEEGFFINLSDEAVLIGNWNYIKATATLMGGEIELSSTAYARETETKKGMDASQITGSASSYARKYALQGLLGLDDGKDADSDDNRAKGTEDEKISKSMAEKIGALLNEVNKYDGELWEELQSKYAIKKITDIRKSDFNEITKLASARLDKMENDNE